MQIFVFFFFRSHLLRPPHWLTSNGMVLPVFWRCPTVLSDTCWSGAVLLSRLLDQSGGGGGLEGGGWRRAAPPICLSLHWSGGATGCPRLDDGEGVTHAAWGAADKDATWQDKEREAADSGEPGVSEVENQSGGSGGGGGEWRREHMASERLRLPPL